MRRLLTFLGMFSFVLNAFSQDVNLFTYWHKGDIQELVVKEGFVEYEGEKLVKKEITASNVRLTVLAETDTSYTLEWFYKDSEVDRLNVEVEEDPIDQRIDEMFSTVKFVYRTDEYGTFKEILNMEELINAISDSIDVLVKEMDDFEDEEDTAMFSEMMKGMFASEAMQDELIRDIWNYHFYLGNVYRADTLIEYVDDIENKMGGEPIPAKGVVTIRTDLDAKTIAINDSKTFKEAAVEEAINDLAKKLKTAKKKKLKKELKNNDIEVTDIENYRYDVELGWLKHYEKKRIFQTQDARKERFLIIEEVQH